MSASTLAAKFPDKKYEVIYADPPWQFKNYSDETATHWVGDHYSLMRQEDIAALPVGDISEKDSTLFLWATYPTLPRALELMESWGFRYKTVAFTWAKTNILSDSFFTGMGYWTRSNAEICLLGTRGHPKRVSKAVRQLIVSPRRAHSQKPDEARERIVELMGDVPRIELFARGEAPLGWDAWGDEVV